MSKRISKIKHGDKEIVYLDFSNANTQQLFDTIAQAKKIISSYPQGEALTLTNVSKAHYSLEIMEALKDFVLHNKPYVSKAAVIGIDSFQKVIYNSIVRFSERYLMAFDDIEEAKDWLTDRRLYPRVEDEIKIKFTLQGDKKISGEGVTKDISLGGVCFGTDTQIPIHSELNLEIFLLDGEFPINVKGRVAWQTNFLNLGNKKAYNIGIEFLETEFDDRQRLLSYVFGHFKNKF